jgi:7,8-dihydropterin-6-yl-methyl-4-(beta-D-ribofuranosyl)aminobenzene 5'-phosphate synthase
LEQLQELGVEKVAPSHCTGDRAIRLFAAGWKESCLSSGCGARITVP